MSRLPARLDEAELVAGEYATEERFLVRRRALVDWVRGTNAEQLALAAVAEARPRDVLDAGAGPGSFAERLRRELGVSVVAVDVSPRMVEVARERGLDARVADIRELPFADASFDCVVAAWVLHHVPDLDRGLSELGRVLRPAGRLVAVAFGRENLAELYELLDQPGIGEGGFSRETGEAPLRRRFARVERRDAEGTVVFPDRDSVERYLRSLVVIRGSEPLERLPQFDGPFRARSSHAVFVAEKAS